MCRIRLVEIQWPCLTGQQVLPCFNTSSEFLFPRTKNSSYASTAIYKKSQVQCVFLLMRLPFLQQIIMYRVMVQIYRSQNKSMGFAFCFRWSLVCHPPVIPVVGWPRRKDHLFQPREAHGFWGLSTHHWGGGSGFSVWRSGRGSEDTKNLGSIFSLIFLGHASWQRLELQNDGMKFLRQALNVFRIYGNSRSTYRSKLVGES